jgi:hypothetical protein
VAADTITVGIVAYRSVGHVVAAIRSVFHRATYPSRVHVAVFHYTRPGDKNVQTSYTAALREAKTKNLMEGETNAWDRVTYIHEDASAWRTAGHARLQLMARVKTQTRWWLWGNGLMSPIKGWDARVLQTFRQHERSAKGGKLILTGWPAEEPSRKSPENALQVVEETMPRAGRLQVLSGMRPTAGRRHLPVLSYKPSYTRQAALTSVCVNPEWMFSQTETLASHDLWQPIVWEEEGKCWTNEEEEACLAAVLLHIAMARGQVWCKTITHIPFHALHPDSRSELTSKPWRTVHSPGEADSWMETYNSRRAQAQEDLGTVLTCADAAPWRHAMGIAMRRLDHGAVMWMTQRGYTGLPPEGRPQGDNTLFPSHMWGGMTHTDMVREWRAWVTALYRNEEEAKRARMNAAQRHGDVEEDLLTIDAIVDADSAPASAPHHASGTSSSSTDAPNMKEPSAMEQEWFQDAPARDVTLTHTISTPSRRDQPVSSQDHHEGVSTPSPHMQELLTMMNNTRV